VRARIVLALQPADVHIDLLLRSRVPGPSEALTVLSTSAVTSLISRGWRTSAEIPDSNRDRH
jgi:hypothetical protein